MSFHTTHMNIFKCLAIKSLSWLQSQQNCFFHLTIIFASASNWIAKFNIWKYLKNKEKCLVRKRCRLNLNFYTLQIRPSRQRHLSFPTAGEKPFLKKRTFLSLFWNHARLTLLLMDNYLHRNFNHLPPLPL